MITQLRNRRSIREFKLIPIDPQVIELLKEALLRSPSSRGLNPCEFIFITQADQLDALSKVKDYGSEFLSSAALAIVICADEKKSDVWIEDCSVASIIVQLAAQSLALGSCWIQVRNRKHDNNVSSEEYTQNLLGIPSNIRVVSIIAIGYPVENQESVDKGSLDYGKIHTDFY
jgi:nitroreductase